MAKQHASPTPSTAPVPVSAPALAPVPTVAAAPLPAVTVAPMNPQQALEQARFASAMSQVQTTVDDSVDGAAPSPRAPQLQPQQRPINLPQNVPWEQQQRSQHVQQPPHYNPNMPAQDPALMAHRAMLAEDEQRLEALRARNPIPAIPDISPLPYSHLTATQQRQLTVRHDADPLHVDAYQILTALLAGGVISPAYNKQPVLTLVQKLEAAIVWVPATTAPGN